VRSELAFDDLRWLHLLWVVLLVVLAGAYGVWQRRRAMQRFAGPLLVARLAPRVSWPASLARLALVGACLTLLTAAIIGPRWGEREVRVQRRGIDLMIVLDTSRSMLARDVTPNRLERAKLAIRDDLLPALGGDRVGLIAFAGQAVLMCPLTTDYGFFRLALEDTTTASALQGGTMIGDALRRAATAFDDKLDTTRVVLLITDGEDHDSFPVEAAQKLWEESRIPVVAIAMGDPREGARVPVTGAAGETYLEHQGETVWSKADFAQLRRVAAASPLNRFVGAGTRNFDLGEIYREAVVPFVNVQEREEMQRIPLPAQFQWFAVAALALLLADSLLRDGPRPRPSAVSLSAGKGAAA
jgi:Ca-activated chloride channel family protein